MPKDDFEQAIAAAMDGTNNEIFDSAWGREESVLDETGDTSIEAMGEGLEGQHEPEDEDDGDDAEAEDSESETESERKEPDKAAAKQDAKPDKTEPEGRVPPGRLREANERARAAEAARDALKGQFDDVTKALNERLELALRRIDDLSRAAPQPQPQVQTQPKPPEIPDLFEDPKGFVESLNRTWENRLAEASRKTEEVRLATSMQMAHAVHKDAFEKAWTASQQLDMSNPDNQVVMRRIGASPNPGEALVAWHKRNEALREVGDDPGKYRERIATETRDALMKDPEFRKQLLADLRAEAEGDGNPNTVFNLPRSLNGARGTRAAGRSSAMDADDSQQSVFDQAWR